MVNCQNSNGSWTNCNATGPNMATCTTMGGTTAEPAGSSEGGYAFGQAISTILQKRAEASFRKKIGAFLAAGDCEGAAKFALEKGRLDVGPAIAQACAAYRTNPTPVSASRPLAERLSLIASNAKLPAAIDQNTTLRALNAQATTLLVSASVKDPMQFTSAQKESYARGACSADWFGPLIADGATVKAEFRDSVGRDLGGFTLTSKDCGL